MIKYQIYSEEHVLDVHSQLSAHAVSGQFVDTKRHILISLFAHSVSKTLAWSNL